MIPASRPPGLASSMGLVVIALLLGLGGPARGGPDDPSTPKTPPPDRLASATTKSSVSRPERNSASAVGPEVRDPIAEAKDAIHSCQKSFAKIKDYSFTFFKRERIDGQLSPQHVMRMKIRNHPLSVYAKFKYPNKGREAIYVTGGYSGKAVVHDVGLGKLIAGTMKLDPNGSTAMEDCRHPITEAGIGHMIDTIATAWSKELAAGESIVRFHPTAKVGDRACTLIETIHPRKQASFLFHKVRVYVDREHNVPIRFEAYDWPRDGRPAELVEEYTYSDLKLNVGLKDADFDPSNSVYSFGRF